MRVSVSVSVGVSVNSVYVYVYVCVYVYVYVRLHVSFVTIGCGYLPDRFTNDVCVRLFARRLVGY